MSEKLQRQRKRGNKKVHGKWGLGIPAFLLHFFSGANECSPHACAAHGKNNKGGNKCMHVVQQMQLQLQQQQRRRPTATATSTAAATAVALANCN